MNNYLQKINPGSLCGHWAPFTWCGRSIKLGLELMWNLGILQLFQVLLNPSVSWQDVGLGHCCGLVIPWWYQDFSRWRSCKSCDPAMIDFRARTQSCINTPDIFHPLKPGSSMIMAKLAQEAGNIGTPCYEGQGATLEWELHTRRNLSFFMKFNHQWGQQVSSVIFQA